MMVGIPLFGTRVSPRFDCGAVFLVAQVENGAVMSTEQMADAEGNSLQRIARLRELGVDTVVCGAITGFLLRHLAANGIRVFPWVFCEASEALEALARGELSATPPPRVGRGPAPGRRRRGMGPGGPRWSR